MNGKTGTDQQGKIKRLSADPTKSKKKASCTKRFTGTPSRTRISEEQGGDETYGPIVFYVLPGDEDPDFIRETRE